MGQCDAGDMVKEGVGCYRRSSSASSQERATEHKAVAQTVSKTSFTASIVGERDIESTRVCEEHAFKRSPAWVRSWASSRRATYGLHNDGLDPRASCGAQTACPATVRAQCRHLYSPRGEANETGLDRRRRNNRRDQACTGFRGNWSTNGDEGEERQQNDDWECDTRHYATDSSGSGAQSGLGPVDVRLLSSMRKTGCSLILLSRLRMLPHQC